MLPARRSGQQVANVWDDPFRAMEARMNQLMRRIWDDSGNLSESATGIYPVDVHEDQGYVTIEAELPGFKREEIDLSLESGVLTISAERKAESREGTKHLSERRYTRVMRSFTLPTSVDETQVDAELKEGVLTVRFPKREESKPRRIEVKA
jgi:HSP20 family protein